jgi:large subunit ribosomal protein L23
MKSKRNAVIRPIITEKISNLSEKLRQYAFEVDKKANKIEIKQEVESRFDVAVENVRTMNILGKMKRRGRTIGRRSSWKKAIVTLKEGHSIKYFENI